MDVLCSIRKVVTSTRDQKAKYVLVAWYKKDQLTRTLQGVPTLKDKRRPISWDWILTFNDLQPLKIHAFPIHVSTMARVAMAQMKVSTAHAQKDISRPFVQVSTEELFFLKQFSWFNYLLFQNPPVLTVHNRHWQGHSFLKHDTHAPKLHKI